MVVNYIVICMLCSPKRVSLVSFFLPGAFRGEHKAVEETQVFPEIQLKFPFSVECLWNQSSLQDVCGLGV